MAKPLQRDTLRDLLRRISEGESPLTPEQAADVILEVVNENYDLKKELTPAPIPCAHDWDEGHNGVSKCKVCGKYSA